MCWNLDSVSLQESSSYEFGFVCVYPLSTDFHAFWEKAYSELTVIVSDTTSESDPVATDFYLIGERGKFLILPDHTSWFFEHIFSSLGYLAMFLQANSMVLMER